MRSNSSPPPADVTERPDRRRFAPAGHASRDAVMEEIRLRVLLVEDNPADARLVQELLRDAGVKTCELVHVGRLEAALGALREDVFDAVLLDLGLPEAQGLESLTPISNAPPDVPIVVLSGRADEGIAIQAVQLGAQDYLVKGSKDGHGLVRTVRYAIERKRSEEYFVHVANHDALTNLPNRRLFVDRLSQALMRARRNRQI